MLECRSLDLVDRGGIANTDREVRGTLMRGIWIRVEPNRQALVSPGAYDQAFFLLDVILDSSLHTIHEIVLLVQVVRQEEAHAFVDFDELWKGLAVCSELALIIEIFFIGIKMALDLSQKCLLLSMEKFAAQLWAGYLSFETKKIRI